MVGLAGWSLFMLRHFEASPSPESRRHWQKTENLVILIGAVVQIALISVILIAANLATSFGLIAWSCFYIVTRTILGHLSERARRESKIAIYTACQLVGPIVGFLASLALVTLVSASPESVLAGLALVSAATTATIWGWMRLSLAVGRPDMALLKQGLRFSAPLTAAGFIAWASPNGIRFVVDHFSGAAAVGLISLGWGLGQRLATVLAMAVTAAAFPLAVKHIQANRQAEALQHIALNSVLLFGLLCPATAGALLIASDLVNATIAEPFRATTIAILPIATLAGSLRQFRLHYSDQVLLLLDRTMSSLAISTVDAVATVALCWLGCWWGGLMGAALGCLAGSIVAGVYSIGLGVWKHSLPFPTLELTRVLAATAVMTLALRATPWSHWFHDGMTRVCVESGIGVIVYALALAALSPRRTRNALLGLLAGA